MLITLSTFGVGFARDLNGSTLPSIIHGVQVANITDTGFTVAWITDAAIPGSGSVVYGTSPANAFNGSQIESAPPPGARGDIHVVQVSNLLASTTYYFAVATGGVQDNNGGQYYNVKTGPLFWSAT